MSIQQQRTYILDPSHLSWLSQPNRQATVLMYGQTGSGKTYTMRGIFEAAAQDLFAALDVAAGDIMTCAYAEIGPDGARDILNGGACTARAAFFFIREFSLAVVYFL